jgi:hypothetical protein
MGRLVHVGFADLPWPLNKNLLTIFSGNRITVLVRHVAAHLTWDVLANDLKREKVEQRRVCW